MKNFNPSVWAIEHPQMVTYLMIVIMVAGAISYLRLGRDEDPSFTYKVMVVRTLWPGASAAETESELTERLEKGLQGVPGINYLKSVTRPGESMIFVFIKETIHSKDVPAYWYQVRKKLDDMRTLLPAGVQGPFPNDDFGDVQMLI
jgi:multidrug efflux pump